MILLFFMVACVAAVAAILLIYRYSAIFPYVLTLYVGLHYAFHINIAINVGSINIFVWDLLIVFALLNIVIRLIRDGVPIQKEARLLIFALIAYVCWLEFSEFVHYWMDDTRDFINLIRTSVVNLYPLVALSIILSLGTKKASAYMWLLAFVAVMCSVVLIVKEVLDIGAFVTSSGTVRRGKGEMTVLLHLGLAILLFQTRFFWVSRYLGILLILAGIALLGHRSTFIGTAVLFLVFALYVSRTKIDAHKAIFFIPVGSFIIVSMVLFILFSSIPAVENFRTRLADTVDTENKTSVGRLQKWTVAIKSTKENPLGGTKLNGLAEFYGRYYFEADYGRLSFAEAHGSYIYRGEASPWPPHNMFINVVSRNGVIGLILFLLIIYSALAVLKNRGGKEYFCGVGIILSNLIFLTFNNHYQYAISASLFICLVVIPMRLSLEQNNDYERV